MENQSNYDASRKTVGAIYRDAQMTSHDTSVVNGDLTNEFMKSLTDDLNDVIASNPYQGKAFYVTIHEKKDLQMPRAILRRMITTKYRPYPEDDTIVFFVDPLPNKVEFCWCLPHWSEMDNMLMNEQFFDKEMIADIKAWKNLDLSRFGFTKDQIGNPIANPTFRNRPLKKATL